MKNKNFFSKYSNISVRVIFLCSNDMNINEFTWSNGSGEGLGLGCLTFLSTIFQLYRGGQFYLVEYLKKTTVSVEIMFSQ